MVFLHSHESSLPQVYPVFVFSFPFSVFRVDRWTPVSTFKRGIYLVKEEFLLSLLTYSVSFDRNHECMLQKIWRSLFQNRKSLTFNTQVSLCLQNLVYRCIFVFLHSEAIYHFLLHDLLCLMLKYFISFLILYIVISRYTFIFIVIAIFAYVKPGV